MLAWQIFTHSVRMVFGNFKQALQVALVPVAIGYAVVFAFSLSLGVSVDTLFDEELMSARLSESGGFIIPLIGFGFIQFLLTMWIVVAWHRFILLEEYPKGWVPPLYLDRVLSYLGHALLLFVLLLVGCIPLGIVVGILGLISQILVLIGIFIGCFALLFCLYKLIIILPAAAIGQPIKLAQAWSATSNANGQVVLLLLITGLLQAALNIVSIQLFAIPVIGYFVSYAVSLILSLIGVSIITTMYGVFVEKRELT